MTTEDQLKNTAENLRTQDNRCTADPMFCVQIKVRDCGYDTQHTDNECWWNPELLEVAYDQEPDGDEWEGPYGYKDRWETVMVAFTQAGCEEYLELNGHNDRRRAHNREVRIYAESFQRCPEMLAIRAFLLQLKAREEAAVQCPKAADYIEKLERELAEAREKNAKLISIAERAIDDLRWFYESKADGVILELKQLTEETK